MKKKSFFLKKDVILFKRWQNKGYSILSTIGKLVVILMLPLVYIALSFNFAVAQTDTVDIDDIIINSRRKTVLDNENARIVNRISQQAIATMPNSSVSEIIDGSLGVDFRRRGAADIQADISIRGGNFDQNLILLNGIPISDPQTGHNLFALPIGVDIIKKIEISQGPATRLFGIGAYSGAINFVTENPENKQVTLAVEGGQHRLINGSIFASLPLGKNFSLNYSGAYNSSDGYTENTDYKAFSQFLSLVFKKNNVRINNQISFNAKNYGAYNFYTPRFPFQYEKIAKIQASSYIALGRNSKYIINVFCNAGTDEFQLFREGENWYQKRSEFWVRNNADTAKYMPNVYEKWNYYGGHNYHLTGTLGASFSSFFSSIIGTTNYGLSVENNQIKSTVLGNDISDFYFLKQKYTKGDARTNFNVFIDNKKSFGKFSFSVGANAIYNKVFGFFSTFGGDVSMNFTSHSLIYSSVNQGVRMPTFTDLYYNGPSNVGNPNLSPEKSTTYEIGWKYFESDLQILSALFYRNGKNTIDWVKKSDTEKWQTMNYTEINTTGFQIAVNKKMHYRFIDYFNINYTYLYQNKPQKNYISKYTLNYLRHNLSFSMNHEIIKNLFFSWRVKYGFRNGAFFMLNKATNAVEEKPFGANWLVSAKISYSFGVANFYVQGSNLLDADYYDISYIKLPGRWIKAGVKIKLMQQAKIYR